MMSKNAIKKLADFAEEMIRSSWDGYDMDGGHTQELAVEYGLIEETIYDPKKHGPNDYDIEPGDPYFIFTASFEAALKSGQEDQGM